MPFPINLIKPKISPLTIHGAKTQSIPFIFKTITWDAKGKWIEGFLGAGTILLKTKRLNEETIMIEKAQKIRKVIREISKVNREHSIVRFYLSILCNKIE